MDLADDDRWVLSSNGAAVFGRQGAGAQIDRGPARKRRADAGTIAQIRQWFPGQGTAPPRPYMGETPRYHTGVIARCELASGWRLRGGMRVHSLRPHTKANGNQSSIPCVLQAF